MPHDPHSNARLPPLSRRAFAVSGILGLAAVAARPQAAQAFIQKGLAAAARGVSRSLVNRALLALARHNSVIWSRDVVAIVDFGLPSSLPRLHLINILDGTTTSLFVTHGKGSDPDHTGYLQSFSDGIGSNATAEGAYLTDDIYTGVHGLSRRLVGLDPSNTHAEERAIVIHSAWYADPAILVQQGKLGRSDGCFAVADQDIALLLTKLGQGRLLYVGRN